MNNIIEQHYRNNYPRLVGQAKNRLGGNHHLAEDAVQEAYSRAIRYLRSYDKDRSFNSWFNMIFSNSVNAIKQQELNRGLIKDIDEIGVVAEESFQPISDKFLLVEKVEGFIKEVNDPGPAEVLVLYFCKGFSNKEVAELTPYTFKAVDAIITRFKPQLLAKYGLA